MEFEPENSDRNQTREEYLLLLSAFNRFRYCMENSAERWEVVEDIINLRASFLIDRVLTGLRMDFDRALDLLKNFNEFISDRERQERDILVAAIDNLVDFAAYGEAKMLRELPEGTEFNGTDLSEQVFEKYNLHYATEENQDVLFAAGIAAWWISVAENSLVTFMTQGDERVRATHLSLEGLSYRKNEFPPDLIPPIEWGCRCFLISDSFGSVTGSISDREYKEYVNPVFGESLAKCGKIFSGHHPYFETELPEEIKSIAKRIKSKFHIL